MPDCIACGEDVKEAPFELHRDSVSNRDFELYRCSSCGVVFSLLPGDFALEEWYAKSHYYGEYEYAAHHGPVTDDWRFNRFLSAAAALGLKGRLLDVGCGEGGFLLEAQRRAWAGDLTGLDLHQERVSRSEGGVDIRAARFEDFLKGFSGEPFDVITLFDVLDHFPRTRDVVAGLKRVLAPGGHLAVTVPNLERIHVFDNWEEFDFPPNHFTRWSRGALGAFLERQGFEVVRADIQFASPRLYSEQIFYKLYSAALPAAKRLLFGSGAQAGGSVEELLSKERAAGARHSGVKGALSDKDSRKRVELFLVRAFNILAFGPLLPAALGMRLIKPRGGPFLFTLARLRRP